MILVADEEDALVHDGLISQLAQIGGDIHDAEIRGAAGRQIHKVGDRDLVQDYLYIGIELGEQGHHIGKQDASAPGGHADVENGPLFVLQVLQIADQLAVQITLPL